MSYSRQLYAWLYENHSGTQISKIMPEVVHSYLYYLQTHQLCLITGRFDAKYFIIINQEDNKLILLCDDLRQIY